MSDDIADTRAELADVLALLADSPDDEDLLQLKSDLEELIALHEGEGEDDEDANEAPSNDIDERDADDDIIGRTFSGAAGVNGGEERDYDDGGSAAYEGVPPSPLSTEEKLASKPKKTKPSITSSSEFKIPENLKLQSTDTEEEKLKKRKKVKRLKQKFNSAKGEAVSTEKAASWKSFVKGGKKSKKRKGVGKDSQFKTKDDGEAGGSEQRERKKFSY
mmetsp:Transcript_17245/g.35523  ORF Transcript_17245/g.35523 Transcript_17245/m.35523 type:complete len:218 (+) Transcript_17245:78-731(+)|eukprot:CAMPEP_0118648810 /NCGR_PEP_ID=MMETSP0785-20121206/9363_1 /TAXON_ID=91992 /ORGANISM="Bolidomonas pacifica, Strain CCMP 1866" /LENGTH=217 /DNA_ID=CAMNT_0006541045 /DNA_START=46 /DNA_END=699 /DNA_ORIENTATION=-